ncbi:MAG: hypothetical protein B7Z80_21970 [Rhodospirillales bacterium 20-64-7]|nr:MAG: hypothetical protein B7Z80_21970 [Rhodospirillales bacterium 20-64-7]
MMPEVAGWLAAVGGTNHAALFALRAAATEKGNSNLDGDDEAQSRMDTLAVSPLSARSWQRWTAEFIGLCLGFNAFAAVLTPVDIKMMVTS